MTITPADLARIESTAPTSLSSGELRALVVLARQALDLGDPERIQADRDELRDWRTFGFAHCGPPITCDFDMREQLAEQWRVLARGNRRALELESALAFLDIHARVNLVSQARHLPATAQNAVALARSLGWPGLQSEGGKEQGEHG